MKYNVGIIGLLLICTTVFQNCGKDDDADTPAFIPIEDYISQNNISPEYTSTGLGYIIDNPGDARRATDMSTVKADVLVKTTDNVNKIDTQGDLLLNLFSQIPGLTEGLQLVGPGGEITLYVPFELAWGAPGNSSIPSSADVIIEISMTDILLDIKTYIEENNIQISDTTASDVYVLIEEEGDGTFPDINSLVNVAYSGYYTNGDVFDSSSELQIALAQVIRGWQEGIPKFSKGGKGKLFIPYEAAYGANGSQSIPGRTDLIFDIELLDF